MIYFKDFGHKFSHKKPYKYLATFWVILKNGNFFVNTAVTKFLGTFGKSWATFYSRSGHTAWW